ncbi:MAG: tyrosine-type recombinase/integrase [Firmicutes bacterium]|nr:tyrosine-type recombinase/integrase [Bacillota bacterium]
MKLPNKYGSITKLKGPRRRPYMVREGTTGRQRVIGYAATREEALEILAGYNKKPWDIDAAKLTFSELYALWLEKKAPKLGESNHRCLIAAYKHCKELYDMPYVSIRTYHMQDCIDSCSRSGSTKAFIKSLFYHLDNYAMEIDIISKRYSDMLDPLTVQRKQKVPFTDEEVARVWQHEGEPWVDSVLFLLYTGFRISEMFNLKVSDVDFENGTMTGGVKTAAGKNRIVPIHSKILHIVKARAAQTQSGYLFELDGQQLRHSTYYPRWGAVMQSLGMNHAPHECRHTLRSRLDSAGANKVCIDRIMGHASEGTGERIYTHKTIEELRLNLELVTD